MSEYNGTDNSSAENRSKTNKMKSAFEAFGNIFGLNICFIIGCLPIFTIGASLTALYSMCIRLQEDEEETILVGFIHEFKRNFKQATLTFLLLIVAFAVMWAEFLVIVYFSGILVVIYTAVLAIEVLVVALIIPFLFPLIARYDSDFWTTIKNAFLLSVGFFGSWIKIVVAWVAPFLFSFVIEPMIFIYTWYLWLLLFFGLIAYGTSYTIRNVFAVNEARAEKTREENKEKEVKEAKEENKENK